MHLSNCTFSIIYKPGRNDQDADTLSRIQWSKVMEMTSQTVKAVHGGMQISYGKVGILSNSTQALSHLFRDSTQPGMPPADWSQAHS